jgi:hypothetical protein
MLAEVGLPPGADVDRSSLDSAVADSGWNLQSHEVQPDRVVFYLWPRAGGTTFSFSLKARFSMKAQSSESLLYRLLQPTGTSLRASSAIRRPVVWTGGRPVCLEIPTCTKTACCRAPNVAPRCPFPHKQGTRPGNFRARTAAAIVLSMSAESEYGAETRLQGARTWSPPSGAQVQADPFSIHWS